MNGENSSETAILMCSFDPSLLTDLICIPLDDIHWLIVGLQRSMCKLLYGLCV